MEINKITTCSDEEFEHLIRNSTNVKEVLFKLGYTTSGNSWGYSKVKERMTNLNLSYKDFKGKSGISNSSKISKIPIETLLNEKTHHPRCVVRKRIIQEGLIEYKCAICGISHWNGKILNLELDHINGVNNDNRLSNLRFLCPNCHSQTSTYGAKNKDIFIKDFEITEEMKQSVLNSYQVTHNINKTAKVLGYKRIVVREIINMLGLSKPNQRYVIRYNEQHEEIQRYGSINECCKSLINSNEVRTKTTKVCRATLFRNIDNKWLNSYWKILDA